MGSNGVYVVGRFVDDYGCEIVPCTMGWEAFMARYYFFKGEI